VATYIRFAVAARNEHSDQQQGVFQALYTLKRAISWFKLSATEHVSRMRELVALLEHKDIAVEEFRTDKPGYIVYDDAHQVAAIPFTNETF
jgi:hypothetical protein